MKTTLAAEEVGLGLTVTAVGVATPIAPLAGMPGVNCGNLAAKSLSFIFQESLKLSEAPGVKPAFRFATACLDPIADVGEVFHNDSRARLNAFEDRGGEDVIAIPSEALFTPSEASKVPFGTLSAFGLQCTPEAEGSFNNLFHVPVSVEAVIRCNGGPGNPKVNTDSLPIAHKGDIGQFNNNMKVEPAFAEDKVSGRRRVGGSILSIFRQLERYLHSAMTCRHTNKPSIPVDLESVQIIARRTGHRLRTGSFMSVLLPANYRLHGFAGFVYRLNMQVRDETGQGIFAFTVGKTVNRISIASVLLPALTAGDIEGLSKLANSLMQSIRLLWRRLKLNSYCSIHKVIISYNLRIMQGKEVCRNSPVA